MTLEDSPSLQDEVQWESDPEYQEPEAPKGRRTAWVVISVLAVIGIVLGVVNFFQSDVAAGLVGKGAVTGYALGESGEPVTVDVFVVGHAVQAQSDEDGAFRLNNIPAGDQVVVVGYQGLGHEFPVTVVAGSEVSLGQVRVVETQPAVE